MRKEKKREKEKTLPVDQRPGGLPEPACPSFLSFAGGPTEPSRFSLSLPRPRGPAQEAAAAARLPSLRR
jgi:hypothetical protein